MPSPVEPAQIRAVVDTVADLPGPLLLALQAVQDEFGWVPPEAVPVVADVLNVSRAEVHGVLTFYHDLRTEPPARAILRLCVAEACQATGAREVRAAAESAAATGDDLAVEPVYCLGLCSVAPAALAADRPVGRLTPGSVTTLVASLRGGA